MTAVTQEGGTSYSQVFLDIEVALKPLTTPARAKKQKPTLDLGITPLKYETTSRAQATTTVSALTQVVTDNVTRTPANVGVSWTLPKEPTQQLPMITNEDVTIQYCNQNTLFRHMDEFGNLVKVQGPVESTVESRDVFVPATERSIVSEPTPAPIMDILRSNPLIQQMVEERLAVLEAKMKLDFREVWIASDKVAGTMCQTLLMSPQI